MNNFLPLNKSDKWVSAFVLLFPFVVLWVPLGGEVLSLMVLLWWLFKSFKTGDFILSIWRNNNTRRIFLSLLAIIFIKISSLVWSIDPDLSWRDVKKHLHLLMFIPFLFFLQGVNKEKLLKKALAGAFLAGGGLAIARWGQSGMPLSNFEYAGATGNSLVFGLILTLWAIAYVLSLSRGIHWFDWLVLGALLLLIIFNGKRSVPLITFMGLFFSGFYLYRGKCGISVWKRNFSVAMVLSCMVIIFYINRPNWVILLQQVKSFFEVGLTGGSIDSRLQLAGIAWGNWLDNPWLGSGAGTAHEVIARSAYSQTNLSHFNHFHNIFLQWLSDVGILGFALSVGAMSVIHCSISSVGDGVESSESWCRSWFMSLIPVTLLYGLANLSFGINLFHLVFAFVLALALSSKNS